MVEQVNGVFESTSQRFTGQIPLEVLDISSLGKGLSVVKNSKVAFTKEMAERLLQMKAVPWERPLRNNHVSFLIGEMKKGTFLTELATLATCVCEELGGDEHRINGQHTAWARAELPDADYTPSPITMLKYRAITVDDMRRLYASFDRGAPRTRSNVIEAYLGGTEQFGSVSPTLVKLLASSLAFWLWESPFMRGQHSADDVAYLMQRDHADLVNKVAVFAGESPILLSLDFLRRASVVAAMMETFSKAQKQSEEFWHAVKIGIGFTNADDPRLRLRNALMTCNVMKSTAKEKKKAIDQETMYRWCIAAWNAWRSDEPVKSLRAPNKRHRAK